MREGWKETTLGEVASVERGVSWSKEQESWQPVQGAVPVVRIGNVQLSGIAMSETLYVRNVKKTSIDMKAILTSTILMVGSNGNPDRVGNVHLAGTNLSGHLYASFLIGIDCGASSLPEFLWMYLQSQAVQARISEATAGSTGLKNIRLAWLRSMVVQIPPLAEQKRIVDVIGAVDAYVAALESYANAARTARAALLHELLTTNTEGWKETTLGEVAILSIGRTPSRANAKYWTDDLRYPFCTIADMAEKQISPSREGVTQAAIDDGKARHVRAGSLLMSFKLTIGRVGFAAVDLFPNEAIVAITPGPSRSTREFLYFWLGSHDLTEGSGRAVKGATLNSASLAAIRLLLPPLTEQKRIVDVIGTVDGAIAGADRAAEDARNLRSGLLSDLLSGDHGIPESYDELLAAA